MKPISSEETKRQILISAEDSDIRKRIDKNPNGIPDGEYIAIGNELEEMTKTRGWPHVEAFMIRHMNLTGLAFSKENDTTSKGVAQGYIVLFQYIQSMIAKKDGLIEKQTIEKDD